MSGKNIKLELILNNYKGIRNLDNFSLSFNENNIANIFYGVNGVGKTTLCKALSSSSVKEDSHPFFNDIKGSKKNLFKENNKDFKQSNIFFIEELNILKEKEKYGINIFIETKEKEIEYLNSKKEIDLCFKSNHYLKTLRENRSLSVEDISILYDNCMKLNIETDIDIDIDPFYELYEIVIKQKNILNSDLMELVDYLDEYQFIKSQTNIKSTPAIRSLKEFEKIKEISVNIYAELQKEIDVQNQKEKTVIDALNKKFAKSRLLKINRVIQLFEMNLDMFIKERSIFKNLTDFYRFIDFKYLKINASTIMQLKKNKAIFEDIMKSFSEKEKYWNDICKKYNSIFINMPVKFKLLKDKNDITNEQYFQVKYNLKNPFEDNYTLIDGDENIKKLYEDLSGFEKKGLFIFDLFFKIESALQKNKDTIFLFDDIIDSFDEVNRLSFAFYLKDLQRRSIKFILFTHDFNFFKLLKNKLREKTMYILRKDKLNNVYVKKDGSDFDYIFKNWINNENIHKEMSYLISSIPLVRELSNIIYDDTLKEKLLPFLHHKNNTKNLKINDALKIIIPFIKDYNDKDYKKIIHDNYLEVLYKVCDEIMLKSFIPKDISHEITSKICLAICIRLQLEEKIILLLGESNTIRLFENLKTEDKQCQTNFLLRQLNKKNEEYVSELLKYDIATSNIIHLNSFNYEALFYYSLDYLVSMLKEIQDIELHE